VDPMNMDRVTCLFLSLCFAYQKNDKYASKYLALSRKPEHLFQGLGVFDKRVTFWKLRALARAEVERKYEAKGKALPPARVEEDEESVDDGSSASGMSDADAKKEEEVAEDEDGMDEMGFINPKVFHPAAAPTDLGALRAMDLCLDFGLPDLALFLLAELNSKGYLREETLCSERAELMQARALMLDGRYEEALTGLARVQDKSGDRCQVMWIMLGKCLRELKRPERAVGALEKAIAFLTPCEDPEVYIRLGSIYLEHDDWERARKYLVKSLEFLPTASAWYGAGVAAYQLGQYEEAYAAFVEANGIDRERTVLWAWLCAAALRLERASLALQAARYVLVDDESRFQKEAAWPSTWPEILQDIAEGFVGLGLPGPAKKAAQLSIQIPCGGDSHIAYYLLGRAHALQGDKDRACSELEVAIGLAFDSEDKYDYAEIASDFAASAHDVHLQQRIFNAVSFAEQRAQREQIAPVQEETQEEVDAGAAMEDPVSVEFEGA